ncbi:MAG TPA: hypothetical protein VKZ59_04800 [Acidobacteriota bacterium]|nr:hypothetical protein [Acidobacteriota bacterium]
MITLTVFLSLLQLAALPRTSPGEELLRYRNSPIQVRRELRQSLQQGLPTKNRIEAIVAATGDHSFDGLKNGKNGLLQAIGLQEQALDHWSSNRHPEAILLYQKAYRRFQEIGATSEAVFCLYFVSEILAENERFAESFA